MAISVTIFDARTFTSQIRLRFVSHKCVRELVHAITLSSFELEDYFFFRWKGLDVLYKTHFIAYGDICHHFRSTDVYLANIRQRF